MTLQQLKYMMIIADCGSLSKAAEIAYISQPSLSASLKELENEINIQLFNRTNRGLQITTEGSEFLAYCRQVVEQYGLIEEKYVTKTKQKESFCVSTQHYSFAVKAFIDLVERVGMDSYELAVRETKTHEVIDDVRHLRSELGILYLNTFNRAILNKMFSDYGLVFKELIQCKVYVYLAVTHPLAKCESLTIEQLEDYPCLSFEQGKQNSFYFAEEALSVHPYKKRIKANDRATMLNLMTGLDAYTLCSGIISEELNGSGYSAIPLVSDEVMHIGYIKKKNIPLSELAIQYLESVEAVLNKSASYS